MLAALRSLSLVPLVTALATPAHAESWCAQPLYVHEWGVHVFAADGKPLAVVDFPSWFHRAEGPGTQPLPVRDLPADSGERALPVMHFYSPGGFSWPIPIGIEVGFQAGTAAMWYPAVDHLRSAALANTALAQLERMKLLASRTARGLGKPHLPLPPDPTRQLVWDRLELSPEARLPPRETDLPWIRRARELGALWVEHPRESERFVFYEAGTREAIPLVVRRGPTWQPTRRHLVVENRGKHAVHDVFFVHREADGAWLFEIPSLPPGKSAGFVLEDHPLTGAPRERLRQRLVDAAQPAAPPAGTWDRSGCVMMRDPAIPVERAAGHRLYAPEAELILDIWSARFFEGRGTTIVYREDVAALDEAMPLSLYTDMYHYIELSRAGLALWENVALP